MGFTLSDKSTRLKKLKVALGVHSSQGRRQGNEDFYGCVTPEGDALQSKGVAVVVADGVGIGHGGRAAAEKSVKNFLADYYSTPDTWSIQKCVEQILTQLNQSIYQPEKAEQSRGGAATTFSALIIKGHRYFVSHVGDSRIYLIRNKQIKLLTQDHVWDHPEMRNVVSRAIGLDSHIHADFFQDELKIGDIFVLCTDGLNKCLPDEKLLSIALGEIDPQTAADQLVHAAFSFGSQDNITTQVVHIESLPEHQEADLQSEASDLPFATTVLPGQILDDFRILRTVHEGYMASIYQAEDTRTGESVALKFPHPRFRDDKVFIDRFLREEWVGKRIYSEYVIPVLPITSGRRSCLYYAMPFYQGETLRQRIKRGHYFSADEVVQIGLQICKGLHVLHSKDIVHRDIKPDNIFIDRNGKVKIMDLGIIQVDGLQPITGEGLAFSAPGTPSYMAPEVFRGDRTSVQSDIYALGVTLYELLTRKYPYGEIEPFSSPRFIRWIPPSRFRPETPFWLEAALQKATEADPKKRYESVSELQFHLEKQEEVVHAPVFRPLLERNPLLVWKLLAGLTTLAASIELWLLLR